jgi:hypothetical protein
MQLGNPSAEQTMMKFLRDYFDLTGIALAVGPVLMAVGFVLLAQQYRTSGSELHEHVSRIVNRDERWAEILKDLESQVHRNADHMKMIEEQQQEIIHRQQDLIAIITGKKLGEMMSQSKKRNSYSYDGEVSESERQTFFSSD